MKMNEIFDKLISGELQPRYHTGVGFMQLYLTDAVRLHVWHPDLPPTLGAFGSIHNHRFDLTSHVLLGSVMDRGFIIRPSPFVGQFFMYRVKPAHFGDTPVPERADDNLYTIEMEKRYVVSAGQSYFVQRGRFHESSAEALTVTLMRKTDQEDSVWARILAPIRQKPVHGMQHDYSQVFLNQCFFWALRRLSNDAIDLIERETSNG